MPRFSLLEELRHGSTWRVLAIYAGAAFAVLQAVDLFVENLALPSWLFTATVVLFALGLPLILLTAWLQRRRDTPRPDSHHRLANVFTWRNALLAGVAAFALLGMASVADRAIGTFGGKREAWARGEGMNELRRLIDDAQWDSVYALSREIEAVIPGDTALESLRPRLVTYRQVRTEPAGVQVSWRFYASADTAMQLLGTTPLDSVAVPVGALRYRLEKEGYQTLERASLPVPGSGSVVRLLAADSAPGMVWVPGGEFGINSPGVDHLPKIASDDYLIGRTEVTNAEYKRFVDAGGYADPQWWREPFTRDGRAVDFADATAGLVDRSGLPGPATWTSGSYPDGEADFPVGGLSWYEAAAYARFAGASLPTVYHWNHAAGTNYSAYFVPFANFSRKSAQPVASGSLHAYGSYDMAGNVREWVWNASGEKRYILGGGWNDESYLFIDVFTQPPWDRSASNGVRLARYASRADFESASAPIVMPRRDFMSEPRASDEVFAIYRRAFAYDRTPLNARVEMTDSTGEDWIRERITFDAAYGGERVIAHLFLPKRGKPPYQTVLYFPGSNVIFARSSATETEARVRDYEHYLRSGRAVLMPVLEGTFERGGELNSDYPAPTHAYRDYVLSWVRDFSRSIDYLETRDEIDTQKLAYYGLSWGGAMGAIVPAVETRFKVNVLYIAGLNFQRALPEVDALNFVGHVRQPTLMLNGRYDHFFPIESSQVPMFKLLGAPPDQKRHVVYDGGHFVPRPQLVRESLAWLDRWLGKP